MEIQGNKALSANKGAEMEERLRAYFLNLGYYVLRGVKFKFNDFDVTDIDLWLYFRGTPLSRERCNVDIKNKKTPQALERIFWAKGVQSVLGLDRCIVATTDSRMDVASFGHEHNVAVLDGTFLGRLEKSSRGNSIRLSEETFFERIDKASLGRLGGDWKRGYDASKSRVLSNLDFDGCNNYLKDINELLQTCLSGPTENDAALRLVYANIGMLLVCVDYIMQKNINLDLEQRKIHLTEGFRFGQSGKILSEGIVRVATRIAAATTGQSSTAEIINRELKSQFLDIRAEVIGEFFAKTTAQGHIFDVAREFEAAAYAIDVEYPSGLSSSAQSVLGALSDYFGFDRKKVISARKAVV